MEGNLAKKVKIFRWPIQFQNIFGGCPKFQKIIRWNPKIQKHSGEPQSVLKNSSESLPLNNDRLSRQSTTQV